MTGVNSIIHHTLKHLINDPRLQLVDEWLVFLFDVKVWVIILAVIEIKDNDRLG